jgi:hypothetical protein
MMIVTVEVGGGEATVLAGQVPEWHMSNERSYGRSWADHAARMRVAMSYWQIINVKRRVMYSVLTSTRACET